MQNTGFSTNKTLNINGRLVDLAMPKVMGILNVTPDSFYDGGKFTSDSAIAHRVEQMIKEGLDFIDIGGYSTRPGAPEVAEPEEAARVVRAISIIKKHFPDTIISVDTFRSSIASAAVNEGAGIINDVSGGQLDPEMFATIAKLNVPYILMHMKGSPQTMNKLARYDNLMNEIVDYFHSRIATLAMLGVKDIVIDPGFGFAKTREHNFTILDQLDNLQIIGKPLLVGLSRKSMIWKTLDISPEEALNGTTALHSVALLKGASILRVHDVKAAKEVIKLISVLNADEHKMR